MARGKVGRDPWKKLLTNIKASGRIWKQTNRECSDRTVLVSPEDLERIYHKQSGRCYWLGVHINPQSIFITKNAFAMSADRLDNDKGYSVENTVITTRFANLGRGSVEEDRFRQQIEPILRELRNDSTIR